MGLNRAVRLYSSSSPNLRIHGCVGMGTKVINHRCEVMSFEDAPGPALLETCPRQRNIGKCIYTQMQIHDVAAFVFGSGRLSCVQLVVMLLLVSPRWNDEFVFQEIKNGTGLAKAVVTLVWNVTTTILVVVPMNRLFHYMAKSSSPIMSSASSMMELRLCRDMEPPNRGWFHGIATALGRPEEEPADDSFRWMESCISCKRDG
eukprot:scaffold1127_cov160-Amphora_coffeaeformis.AAC.4